HMFALTNSGLLYGWGSNGYGQLGLGNTDPGVTPQWATTSAARSALDNPVSISGGPYDGVAAQADGSVFSLGQAHPGSAGFYASAVPQNISDPDTSGTLTDVKEIQSGGASFGFHVALKNDGTVWTWGGNAFGQLGDGTNAAQVVPVQVSGLGGVI